MGIINSTAIYPEPSTDAITWINRSERLTPSSATATSPLPLLGAESPIVFARELVVQRLDAFGLLALA